MGEEDEVAAGLSAEPASDSESRADPSRSTVGTGSVLGLGCLALVLLLVIVAIAYRFLEGAW